MYNVDSDRIRDSVTGSDLDTFRAYLSHIGIVDIGSIRSKTPDGRAEIVSCTLHGDSLLTYKNVEVVYPGCRNGAFTTSDIGSLCLIFIPRACVRSISNQKISMDKGAYSIDGVKALPISSGVENVVRLNFDASGALTLTSSAFNYVFAKDYIDINLANRIHSYMDSEGNAYLTISKTNHATFMRSIEMDSASISFTPKDKNYKYTVTCTEDGFVTVKTTDLDGKNEKIALTLNGADGSIRATGSKIVLNGGEDSSTNDRLVTYKDLKAGLDSFANDLKAYLASGTAGKEKVTYPSLPLYPSFDISGAQSSTLETE